MKTIKELLSNTLELIRTIVDNAMAQPNQYRLAFIITDDVAGRND
ncbi:MAG TPA: hypothetical protein PK431_10440 [Chitinophagales bacterium]|jgi:hypothetical protein|nr:hypothetical protein [Chitinophagales bacterium]